MEPTGKFNAAGFVVGLVTVMVAGLLVPDVGAAEPVDGASHWSFQPVRDPKLPLVKRGDWPRQPLDRFVLAKLEAAGRQPAPPADKRTLLRRATFDLTGLPPTPEELDAFLADNSPGAFATVVERLLGSPHYGERWGRHWLDVVRYADTAGDTADYPVPTAWRYRNYVIDSFNADKPYDEFLREQIAGDILARLGPREKYAERIVATGYLAISRRFGFDSENYHHLTIQDTIDTLGQSVLGLSLGCARCHNHKYDPVSMNEYYGLYGIFESTRYAFPGSEQKQKYRALVPLVPPEESQAKWREFERKFAELGSSPAGVLRSLDELDGDFEMQRAASGGSKGVLVPPWRYQGPISVTSQAQSPFKQVYAFGTVGVSVPAGTNEYRVEQSLYPVRSRGLMHVSLDFRVATNRADAAGRHRFVIGADGGGAAVQVLVGSRGISFSSGPDAEVVALPKPGQWHSLRLAMDLDAQRFSGSVATVDSSVLFTNQPFASGWSGKVDSLALGSSGAGDVVMPGLEFDNIAVQPGGFPAASTVMSMASTKSAELKTLSAQFEKLADIDGGFELQRDGAAPAKPWGPGPNSVMKISSAAQSSFHTVFPKGRLGIRLPNSGAYNGFGQTLTNVWKAASTTKLFASFDFRCANADAGGSGSWRFYLGHGPGSSAAVELFMNGREFFRRSGEARDVVRAIKVGEWCHVRMELDLKARRYVGTIRSGREDTAFDGKFPDGWDGNIDYTFIDSYGHIGGVRPALDADNFVIGEVPLPPLDGSGVALAGGAGSDSERAMELRGRIEALNSAVEKSRRELSALLDDGPFELAYGVTEGTARDARLQKRGEPDQPGEVVPRGLLQVLGGGPLPRESAGSGRLEMARWLASPENPLTARVMVNRIWQYHFGNGLVGTPNDFGVRGQRPTHPELLDHLAREFVAGGWSIKSMHRLILGSATYQQGSAAGVNSESVISETVAREVGDRKTDSLITVPLFTEMFSPFPRRRLSAEEIRDAILFVSGDLDRVPGRGHSFPAATSWGYTQHGPFSAVYDHNKRSVYLMTQRLKRHPFLALFDGADPNASTADRRETTVPTQALYFLNDPFVHAKSEKFAARIAGTSATEAERVTWAHRVALGRPATELEQRGAAEFLEAYRAESGGDDRGKAEKAAWAAYARVLFGGNEFLSVD